MLTGLSTLHTDTGCLTRIFVRFLCFLPSLETSAAPSVQQSSQRSSRSAYDDEIMIVNLD
jgi:hypothetical protein